MAKINQTKTIAEILAAKTPQERDEWMRKDATQAAKSSEIEGLPIPSETILEEFQKCRAGSNTAKPPKTHVGS